MGNEFIVIPHTDVRSSDRAHFYFVCNSFYDKQLRLHVVVVFFQFVLICFRRHIFAMETGQQCLTHTHLSGLCLTLFRHNVMNFISTRTKIIPTYKSK